MTEKTYNHRPYGFDAEMQNIDAKMKRILAQYLEQYIAEIAQIRVNDVYTHTRAAVQANMVVQEIDRFLKRRRC